MELNQINEYETFADKGKGHYPGADYKRINVHFVYAAKPDRLKARLVAGGHLTDTPVESVYSSVVSLRGIRLVTFLAELNGLQTWSTNVGNAYLESFTKEKVYIIAGPEFGDRQGHTLVIVKALYGLKSSGLSWRERFADVLKEMGFSSSLLVLRSRCHMAECSSVFRIPDSVFPFMRK
jgi:Reverse transcriptase (RNA-dependent DNA polymerase)